MTPGPSKVSVSTKMQRDITWHQLYQIITIEIDFKKSPNRQNFDPQYNKIDPCLKKFEPHYKNLTLTRKKFDPWLNYKPVKIVYFRIKETKKMKHIGQTTF